MKKNRRKVINVDRAMGDHLMKVAGKSLWNWIAAITIPDIGTFKYFDQLFQRWVREIEEADGSMNFRWFLLAPKEFTGPDTQAYFAVGGLSSGESRFWVRRWTAISGNSDSRAAVRYRHVLPYTAKVARIFEELLDGKRIGTDYLLTMQIGPPHIQQRRSLKTDDEGMPRDKRLRLKIGQLELTQLMLAAGDAAKEETS